MVCRVGTKSLGGDSPADLLGPSQGWRVREEMLGMWALSAQGRAGLLALDGGPGLFFFFFFGPGLLNITDEDIHPLPFVYLPLMEEETGWRGLCLVLVTLCVRGPVLQHLGCFLQ